MNSNLSHKIVRGIVVFFVLYIVLSLNLGKDSDSNIVKYGLPAAVAALAVYVALLVIDKLFIKSTKK